MADSHALMGKGTIRLAVALPSNRSCRGASDDITGGVVSSDAALSGSWVAYKPVVLKLLSTVGFYKLPEWAGRRIGRSGGRSGPLLHARKRARFSTPDSLNGSAIGSIACCRTEQVEPLVPVGQHGICAAERSKWNGSLKGERIATPDACAAERF